ncbi:MAG: hypothetical protein VB084_08915 [Syntrophomonadaceae bacterium]|nr:hypothetical protein [Syntrophomonadaceae bacterium]
MKEKISECKIKKERGTLIVKDYFRGMSSGNSSVTYSEKELMTMLKKYSPVMDEGILVKPC